MPPARNSMPSRAKIWRVVLTSKVGFPACLRQIVGGDLPSHFSMRLHQLLQGSSSCSPTNLTSGEEFDGALVTPSPLLSDAEVGDPQSAVVWIRVLGGLHHRV